MGRRILAAVFALLLFPFMALSANDGSDPVVIVTSYNPDVKSVADNLAEFTDAFNRSGCTNPLKLENMHCLNLGECKEWKGRMWSLLEKYYRNGNSPAAVVLLGNEASSTFFSMDQAVIKATPVVFGLRGDNIISLPDEDQDLDTWKPVCHYLSDGYEDFNIVGGFVYQYDISRNMELVRRFTPDTRNLAFLSDNSFGGVTLLAHFANTIKAFPEYKVTYLDGRLMSLQDVNTAISGMSPSNTALFIGTWKIDKSGSYALSNTTYALAQSNPAVPAFTLSSVGLGHWPIGGYTPVYMLQGAMMAKRVAGYLLNGSKEAVTILPSRYSFDQQKLSAFDLKIKDFKNCNIVNQKKSYVKENLPAILMALTIILLLAGLLVFAMFALRSSKKLQHDLEKRSIELEKARDKAEEASAMKSNFIANISHEIRTPLNAIVGFSQMLTAPGFEVSEEEKAQFGQYITMNSDVLLHLINDILDLSKMDVNRMSFDVRRVDLVETVRMSVDSVSVNEKPGVKFVFQTSVPSLYLDIDKERISQVVGNLLSNAKKCTEEGLVMTRIDYVPGSSEVTVSVTDSGTGIPEEKAEAVFERFSKLDEYRQGTGLGLPICRSIVEHFGGRIWVDTGYSGGARLVFTLPVAGENA